MMPSAYSSLFGISVLILISNYFFSVIGLLVRQNFRNGEFNEIMTHILVWQGSFIILYICILYVFVRKMNFRYTSRLKIKHLNIVLWSIIAAILILVPVEQDYGSYRQFAPNKSTLPEYTVIILSIILLSKGGMFGRFDRLLLLIFAGAFLVSGYRMVAVYYIIFFMLNYRLRNILFYGSTAFVVILVTQANRIGASSLSVDTFLYVTSINAFDTIYSSAKIVALNERCGPGNSLLLSYFAQAIPLPSSVNPPLYINRIQDCTTIPGGGVFFSYWYYLLGFSASDAIPFIEGFLSLLAFSLLVIVVHVLFHKVSHGMLIVSIVFAFRTFNYGPVALFRPSMFFLLIFSIVALAISLLPKKKNFTSQPHADSNRTSFEMKE